MAGNNGDIETDDNDSVLETPRDISTLSNLLLHVEDDSKVVPVKHMSYILMLCHQNIENFESQTIFPYNQFVDCAGYKSMFKFPNQ